MQVTKKELNQALWLQIFLRKKSSECSTLQNPYRCQKTSDTVPEKYLLQKNYICIFLFL